VNVVDKGDEFRSGNSPLAPKEPLAAEGEAEAAQNTLFSRRLAIDGGVTIVAAPFCF